MDNNTNNGSFSFGSRPEVEPIYNTKDEVNLDKEDRVNSDEGMNEPEIEVVEAEELSGSESKRIDDIFESMNNKSSDNNRDYGSSNDRFGTNDYRTYDRVTCKFCGETVSKDRLRCPRCGHPLRSYTFYTNIGGNRKKNKWIALLLCVLLGGVGAHKFYEGRIIMGLVYALTGGLFGVGVVIDFIALLLKTNPYYV